MDGGVSAGKMLVRSSQGRKECRYYYSAMLVLGSEDSESPGVDGEEIDSDSMIERWLLSEIDRSAQDLGPR